jgi:hypothetical protein
MQTIENQLQSLVRRAGQVLIRIIENNDNASKAFLDFSLSMKGGELSESIKEVADNFRWKNPEKDGFPPIGTVCAIRKHGETMIGRLVDTEEWDDWEVNGEYEDCVEEYFVLPRNI